MGNSGWGERKDVHRKGLLQSDREGLNAEEADTEEADVREDQCAATKQKLVSGND